MDFGKLLDYVGLRSELIRFDLRSIKQNFGWRRRLRVYNEMNDADFYELMHRKTIEAGNKNLVLDRAMQARLFTALKNRRKNA